MADEESKENKTPWMTREEQVSLLLRLYSEVDIAHREHFRGLSTTLVTVSSGAIVLAVPMLLQASERAWIGVGLVHRALWCFVITIVATSIGLYFGAISSSQFKRHVIEFCGGDMKALKRSDKKRGSVRTAGFLLFFALLSFVSGLVYVARFVVQNTAVV